MSYPITPVILHCPLTHQSRSIHKTDPGSMLSLHLRLLPGHWWSQWTLITTSTLLTPLPHSLWALTPWAKGGGSFLYMPSFPPLEEQGCFWSLLQTQRNYIISVAALPQMFAFVFSFKKYFSFYWGLLTKLSIFTVWNMVFDHMLTLWRDCYDTLKEPWMTSLS